MRHSAIGVKGDRDDLLLKLRGGAALTVRQQVLLIVRLSMPAILAQISSIVMQYIDASMVGQLGANDSASIGLVSSSLWLFGGVSAAIVTGFTVQAAHLIGARDEKAARNLMKQAFVVSLSFAGLLALLGALIAFALPAWLGGRVEICRNAALYFLVYVLTLPVVQVNSVAGGMLQASGNMRTPALMNILMCVLDVIFNFVLIFPSRTVLGIPVWGAGLGVLGAALGTSLSQLVVAGVMLFALLERSPMLRLRKGEPLVFLRAQLRRAVRLAIPVGVEQVVMSGAMIVATRIVSSLGTVPIAAHSFATTAESLCYMPGYGIGAAATALIGQSVGAGRQDLTRRLAYITTALGVLVMSVSAVMMYFGAPILVGMLSPDPEIVRLGTAVLRIEAFAEPLFAASIVASGVFRGAGDTLVPSCLNFCSMWLVRLPLSALLAPRFGLTGVWIAMCAELCVRGALFLIRLFGKRWQKGAIKYAPPEPDAA